MILGFTGTRKGMTNEQRATFVKKLHSMKPVEFHHGVCIGSDEQALVMIKNAIPSIKVVSHPPENPVFRSFHGLNTVGTHNRFLKELPYMERNRKIVESVDAMIATPLESEEKLLGGTWYTSRYARKQGVDLHVIWPDGSVAVWAKKKAIE